MSKKPTSGVLLSILSIVFTLISIDLSAQYQKNDFNSKNNFWQKVQFGGGLGLSFGNRYTDISVAPSAIYNVNEYFAVGLGAQYTYVKVKDMFRFKAIRVSPNTRLKGFPRVKSYYEVLS